MLEELFKNILDSDVVKKVTKNLGENEIVNKVKEAVAGNDYAKKLQEGLSSGDLLDKIKSGAQTAGREATKVSLECYQVMTAETTPTVDKVIIGAALAYQFMPNLMNRDNFGPILSLLDNAVTLAIAYNRVKAHVTPEIEEKVNQQLVEWFPGEKPEETAAAEDTPLAQTDAEEPFEDVH